MKTTWSLSVCVIALVVGTAGPATANQDQAAGITIRSEAGAELRGQPQAPTCGDLADPGFLLGQPALVAALLTLAVIAAYVLRLNRSDG